MSFDAWAAQFYPKAILEGVPPDVLDRELRGLTPDPRVVRLDNRQPEFSKPLSDYIKGVVTDGRVAIGRRGTRGRSLSHVRAMGSLFHRPAPVAQLDRASAF